jgi:tetratricopeptide (TPR) repeat protein
MATERPIEFEGAAAAREVVKGYDSASNRWAFSFDSPFWKAIRHAQNLGRRGTGHRVAIIDSGYDSRISRLRARVDTAKSFVAEAADRDSLGHGTAVALLITEVAPECRLDIYQVARDGKPDNSAVRDALKAAAESNADVVNISIAVTSPFQFTAEQLEMAVTAGDGSGKKYALESPPCELCLAASDASANGKLVIAAAGNKPDTASCPARATGVAAAGFAGHYDRVTTLKSGGKQHAAFASGPAAPQTLLLDLSLAQIPGVLGTSFAAPLFAGAGALGLSQQELSGYIESNAAAALAQLFQAMIRSSTIKPDPKLVEQISLWFLNAQSKLTHVHCTYQSQVNPQTSHSDPSECYFCGIFAEDIMVNHGLWLLETCQSESARSLLEAARNVAPWSADATANLGAAMRELGDIPAAIKLYEIALQLRPGFRVYTSELKRLRKRLPGNGSWWSRLWS